MYDATSSTGMFATTSHHNNGILTMILIVVPKTTLCIWDAYRCQRCSISMRPFQLLWSGWYTCKKAKPYALELEMQSYICWVAAEAVLDWFKRFGLPEEWVSDNGSHFKAHLMEELTGRLYATQKFVRPGPMGLWSELTGTYCKRLRVVVSSGQRTAEQKSLVCWVGPFRVTEALAHSFMVEHLLTKDAYEVHGTRLKHFCNADLDVTGELREHIANQGIVLAVRAITEHRYNDEAKDWQLFDTWRGLEDNENSWEPFDSIYSDVPTIVQRYIGDGGHTELEPVLH
ncbi:unnamed protein product [Phytophthora fragariaefolia]|uniref:Unnamed protein product n=1 Tax=Phytophthora fragariaefolia TaxID=1490495 RepID=A0A9W6Y757_9STRA|nr:unnamed protein product [Phytophthora fragariaefolia]